MNRRQFILSMISALVTQQAIGAEMLKGSSAQNGERSRTVWLSANKLTGLRLAKPNEHIQIIFFIDPNCPACAELWQWYNTKPQRKIASLWIPVSYMDKSSKARAVALLRTNDACTALMKNYTDFDYESRRGRIDPAENITLEEQSIIHKNTRFWNKQLFGATPLMLYRTKKGEVLQTIGLLPEEARNEMLMQLAASKLDEYEQ